MQVEIMPAVHESNVSAWKIVSAVEPPAGQTVTVQAAVGTTYALVTAVTPKFDSL